MFLPIILIVAVLAIVASLTLVLTQLFGQWRRDLKRLDPPMLFQTPGCPGKWAG